MKFSLSQSHPLVAKRYHDKPGTDIVEKPDDPPSNRGEYEISGAIDLLIHPGRTVDAVELDGWRIGVGSPGDREEAETRLQTAGQPPLKQ